METVKGSRDFIGEEAAKREAIRKILVDVFERYGFEPTETPIIEYEEFVKGENSDKTEKDQDEAVSDIFKLQDKGKRKLALRYEFTFQLKRLMQNQKLPYRRYQIGPVFRDEPASSNRFRQFTQCDTDVVGVSQIPAKDEAELLAMTSEVLKQLGIKNTVLVNNRKLLNEILKSEGIKEKDWNSVLREIDKYDKLPEKELLNNLKKYKAEKILGLLKQGEKFFSKFEAYKEIKELTEYCNYYGLKIEFSPTIVRGFSYYNGSVFEIKSQGIKETICAGGSYMFNGVQCTGISFGLERVSSLAVIKDVLEKDKYLIVSLGKDKEAIKLVQKLRTSGKNSMLYYGKPSKALDYANSKKIEKVIFVGENEVKAKKFKVKDMRSGKESELKV